MIERLLTLLRKIMGIFRTPNPPLPSNPPDDNIDRGDDDVVSGPVAAPVNLIAPVLNGQSVRGSVLTITPGVWKNQLTLTISGQWYRNGVAIAGQTGLQFTTTSSDDSKAIVYRESATNAGGTTTKDSNGVLVTAPVGVAPTVLTLPTLTAASYQQGVPITATKGTFSGATSEQYRWTRNNVTISGATALSYTPVSADLGTALRFVHVGINQFGTTDNTSLATPSISPPPAPPPSGSVLAKPTISGANKDIGVTLTRNIGSYNTGWTPIAGAWYFHTADVTIPGTNGGVLIGDQATVNTGVIPNNGTVYYVTYRETIEKAATPNEYAYSVPYGPMVAGAAPPPAPVGNIQDLLKRWMFLPNHNGWLHNKDGDLTADYNGPIHNGIRHQAYVTKAIRQSDRSAPGHNYQGSWGDWLRAVAGGGDRVKMSAWWSFMDSVQDGGNQAPNTKVHMRNLRVFLELMNGQIIQTGFNANDLGGDWYGEYSTPGNEERFAPGTGSQTFQWRNESEGGRSIGGMGINFGGQNNLEPYSFLVYGPESGLRTVDDWENNVKRVITSMEVRLILNNPSGPDDRHLARITCWCGGDWYRDNGGYLGEYAHSSLLLPTGTNNSWTLIGLHNYTYNDIPTSIPGLVLPS